VTNRPRRVVCFPFIAAMRMLGSPELLKRRRNLGRRAERRGEERRGEERREEARSKERILGILTDVLLPSRVMSNRRQASRRDRRDRPHRVRHFRDLFEDHFSGDFAQHFSQRTARESRDGREIAIPEARSVKRRNVRLCARMQPCI